MTHVTGRLTAKNRDQLRNPTLGVIEYALPFYCYIVFSVLRCCSCCSVHLSMDADGDYGWMDGWRV